MKHQSINVAVAAALAVMALSAQAETADPGAWYLLPSVGVMHTDNDLKADNNNFAYGMRVGKEVSENLDIQLGLTHARAGEDSGQYAGGNYRHNILGLDALYFLSRDKFRPFLLAGVGAAHNSIHYNGVAPTPNADGSHFSWMANVGLGAQVLITDSIGLQADIRQVFSRAKADGGLFGGNSHETVGNTLLNLGVVFRFGVPKQTSDAGPTKPAYREEPPAPVAAVVPPPQEKKVEPAPQPVAIGPDEAAFAKIAIQAEVLFDFDSATLKPAGMKLLDAQVVEKMNANQQVELLLITGHADRLGSDGYNQKLSEQRAATVKDYLAGKGIAQTRLHSVGKGEAESVVTCDDTKRSKLIQCLQPNRRVVLEIEAQRAAPK